MPRWLRNTLVATALIFVGIAAATMWFGARMKNSQPGSLVLVPNQPVTLIGFAEVPAPEKGGMNYLFTVARPLRGTDSQNRGTVLFPKMYAKLDRTLPVNTLVYNVAKYEGRDLGILRFNPRTVVAARRTPRIAPDVRQNIASYTVDAKPRRK